MEAAGITEYLQNFRYLEDQSQDVSLFSTEGAPTTVEHREIKGIDVPLFINEFWTSRQRQGGSLHEISYRACFKPQLPRFFINLLTEEGDVVYDPFSGRGTTPLEAAVMGRQVISNDINPVSNLFTKPRLEVPTLPEVEERLYSIPIAEKKQADIDLSMFYHPDTEAEIVSIKEYLLEREREGKDDNLDRWIRMVATNRLTGHSTGFFSVYTLPPNQAVSQQRQIKINQKRNQKPEYRDTRRIILKKTRSLLKSLTPEDIQALHRAAQSTLYLEEDARHTDTIPSGSVQLTVTSPPFLDVVQYSQDNWLRCWFNGIDTEEIEQKITMTRTLKLWEEVMGDVFHELYRLTRPGGWVAFEVGEVRNGQVSLEDQVVPLGVKAGFNCAGVLINQQEFTKTSNIWGVSNNSRGTNTNRVVLFYVPLPGDAGDG